MRRILLVSTLFFGLTVGTFAGLVVGSSIGQAGDWIDHMNSSNAAHDLREMRLGQERERMDRSQREALGLEGSRRNPC